ncbi:MAG: PilC/PilY family type IV pilus protein [Woeseiaceae bacterium]|nr:PilC/PilY family type IV pilus protein [Woeseiaceae bacterium]MDX2606970.1 PilC/PilY family type IV pilus protein [Woeseiaceae bacterium]
MKISTRKITWMSVGCAVAMLTGMPAIADDTELLLLNPDPSQNPKPNVMFILDTSGSMTTTQATTKPYDTTNPYPGSCDSDTMYWTDVDVTPVCDVDNVQYFAKSVYHCDYSMQQISGIGSYTDTMVMFRPDLVAAIGTDENQWDHLEKDFHDSRVECQADSGDHGDGTTDYVYALRGTDLSTPFTNVESNELSWGSNPANRSYTVFDGNYLNWKTNPIPDTLSRSVIMKAVTKQVLSSVKNLNVGLMRFNPTGPNDVAGGDRGVGGSVILDLTDLDANRQDVLDAVEALPASGWTPLSETMYESALYWRGLPAKYGDIDWAVTDDDALVSSDPMRYEIPEWDVCAKNYNVMLTDGAPTEDVETPGLLGNLPNFAGALGYAGCDGTAGDGYCLDDVAEYLSVEDVDPVTDGDQFVTTHTIGFADDIGLATTQLLTETATDSGGNYYTADDVETLTKTLLSIIANINDRALSFSAPAVSVNTFNRTQNLNDLYITTFGAKGRAHWPGNLKKYRVATTITVDVDGNNIFDSSIVDVNGADAVDPGTGFFSTGAKSYWTVGLVDGNDVKKGGAAQQLPDPLVRDLYTNNSGSDLTAAANAVKPANAAAFVPADFGLTGATGEPTMDEVIRWARGEDLLDEDGNSTTLVRKTMGDPLHAQPAAVVYGGTADNPEVVIFTATNDGYLHAIDGASGEELWSFIPKELLSNLTRLYFDPRSKYKQYGLDGNVVPVVKDVDRDGLIEAVDGDFVYLIFGMRRGGDSFYSLDVTNKNSPELLWISNLAEFGESWSTPVVARMEITSFTQDDDKAVVVIGGGYDTVHDSSAHPTSADAAGAGLFILDLKTGVELWRAGSDGPADLTLDTLGREMDRAVPNDVRVIDLSGDGLADRMYATDLGGQIWRFDVFNGRPRGSLVTGGVIAQLGGEGLATPLAADTRRFYNSPDVSLITDNRQQRRYISISVGSGYRAHPFDLSASDRFYSVRDGDVFKQLTQPEYISYPIVKDADLVEVSGQTQTVITASDRGWKFTLPYNEKILADSLTFDDQIFFVAFTPDSIAGQICSAGKGTNFLYRVSAVNGDPIVPNIDTLNPLLSDDERRTTLQQGGIAPSPAILFPSPDPDCVGDECKIPPLGCVGVECFDPGFDNNPVRTLWTQDGIE